MIQAAFIDPSSMLLMGLPFGWSRRLSRSKKKHYYVAPGSKSTQWNCPQMEQPVPHDLCSTWEATAKAVFGSHANARLRGAHPRLRPDDELWNTLCYLYFHMRCCIYARIEDGKLVSFVPFCNGTYYNNWPSVRVQPGADEKESSYPGYIENTALWWANGGTVGCLMKWPKIWGSFFVDELVDILRRIAPLVGFAEMFINKRDFPLLRKDRLEAYPHPFLPQSPPSIMVSSWLSSTTLARATARERDAMTFSPILSFYTNDQFEDLPFPVTQDWKLLLSSPSEECGMPWKERADRAFFRGSASGYGVTVETNPRLVLAMMGHVDPENFDCRLTSWNKRLKFQHDGTVACIDPTKFPFQASRKNYVPMDRQAAYRYIFYVDGNVGASRLGALLALGSTVIVVRSDAPEVWLLRYARAGIHYVSADSVSSLPSVLKWCRENEEECERIADRGRRFAETVHDLARDDLCRQIRKRDEEEASGLLCAESLRKK